MAEFPALPLFTDAYLADTIHLTTVQHGAYLLMLMAAWRTKDCALPNDDDFLARITRLDKRTWLSNKAAVLAFWEVGSDAKLRQGRLVDERKIARHRREQNAQAGRVSALKRKERWSTDVPTKRQQSVNPQTQTQSHTNNTLSSESVLRARETAEEVPKILQPREVTTDWHKDVARDLIQSGNCTDWEKQFLASVAGSRSLSRHQRDRLDAIVAAQQLKPAAPVDEKAAARELLKQHGLLK